jgi:hypothetical protein
LSILEGNLQRLFCTSEFDRTNADLVPRVAFAMLHRELKGEEEYQFLIRRLNEALTHAIKTTFGNEGTVAQTLLERQGWLYALQSIQASLPGLLSSPEVGLDSPVAMLKEELQRILEDRSKANRDYSASYERACKELEPTNAGRLNIALVETQRAFAESGIERNEHLRIARHSLHELLGDFEGELCAAGWCLYGLVELWSDSEIDEARRSFATALRRLRLAEATLSAVCLRAKAYLARVKGDHEAALTDITRAMDASADPDTVLEALTSAVALKKSSVAGRLVESCVARSPFWAILILGDPQLAPIHQGMVKALEKRKPRLLEEIQAELRDSDRTAQLVKETSEMCGVDLSAATGNLLTSAAVSATVDEAGILSLSFMRSAIRSSRVEAEARAKSILSSHLELKQVTLAQIEGRHKALSQAKQKKVNVARTKLDKQLTKVHRRYQEHIDQSRVSDNFASRGFVLSCVLFLLYLATGTFMALEGVSSAITRPFGYTGLILAVLPSLHVIFRQALFSIREWLAQVSLRREVKALQLECQTSVDFLELEFQSQMERSEEEYFGAKESLKNAMSAFQAITKPKIAKKVVPAETRTTQAQAAKAKLTLGLSHRRAA